MSNHLKISIVTPSFNQGQFVESTVRSVLEQNYPELEYIFMDGGSTDSTIDVIDKYRDKFFHFRSHRDEGQAAAVAEGFETSGGDILAYLNSDDMLAPRALFYVDAFFFETTPISTYYTVTGWRSTRMVSRFIIGFCRLIRRILCRAGIIYLRKQLFGAGRSGRGLATSISRSDSQWITICSCAL